MADLAGVIEELERASEGSRELDAQVALAAGWLRKSGDDGRTYWKRGDDSWLAIADGGPDFYPTTSIDAALTLVPEGWTICIVISAPDHNGSQQATLHRGEPPFFDSEEIDVCAETTILALCIASLKARRG